MMSMKKTVVAIATVAVAQTTGVQANCCMSCPCSEDVPPINDPKKEVEKPDVAPINDPKKEVEKPVEQTPTPVQPEEPTRMQKCKNAVNARVADCKQGAENCKDRMVNGAETCKNGVKNGVESTKTGVKSAFRKVAAAPKEVKAFAMENPKKCITYSAITLATTAAACLKGNEALAFLRPHLATCSTELKNVMDKVSTPEWFKTVQTSVSKCFKNTTKEVEGKEEKLMGETRAWFADFSMKKALNSVESTVKNTVSTVSKSSTVKSAVQKFDAVSKHVPYTTNTKVQKAVTGVAAAVAVPVTAKVAQKTVEVGTSAYTATKAGCQNAGKHYATAKTAVVNNVVTPVSNFAGNAVNTAMKPVRSAAGAVEKAGQTACNKCGELKQKAKDFVQRKSTSTVPEGEEKSTSTVPEGEEKSTSTVPEGEEESV